MFLFFCFFLEKCDTNLLQSVLQDLEGLRQVPRLSPSPRREQRAARGQRQSHQGQRSPDDPQLAHSPPLQNPMHIGCRLHCNSPRSALQLHSGRAWGRRVSVRMSISVEGRGGGEGGGREEKTRGVDGRQLFLPCLISRLSDR